MPEDDHQKRQSYAWEADELVTVGAHVFGYSWLWWVGAGMEVVGDMACRTNPGRCLHVGEVLLADHLVTFQDSVWCIRRPTPPAWKV